MQWEAFSTESINMQQDPIWKITSNIPYKHTLFTGSDKTLKAIMSGNIHIMHLNAAFVNQLSTICLLFLKL